MLGVLSYFESLGEKQKCIVVFAAEFMGKQARPELEFFAQYAETVYLAKSLAEAVDFLAKFNVFQEPVVLITPGKRPVRSYRALRALGCKVRIVFSEEGIGTYGGVRQATSACLREELRYVRLPRFLKYAAALILILVGDFYFVFKRKRCWQLFDKSLKINCEVRDAYMRVLSRLAPFWEDISVPEKVTLVVTPPLVEYGLIGERQFFSELIPLLESRGLGGVLIKPHPLEGEGKYASLNIVPASYPFEILLFKLNGKVDGVIAVSSTCSYTAKVFFDCAVGRLKGLDVIYPTLSKNQKSLVDGGC